MEGRSKDDNGYIMRIFDSNISKKYHSNCTILNKNIIFKKKTYYNIPVTITGSGEIRVSGRSISGNGSLNIKVIINNDEIMFDENIAFTSQVKEHTLKIGNKRGFSGMVSVSSNNNHGRVRVLRMLISSDKKNNSKKENVELKIQETIDDKKYLINSSGCTAIIVPYAIHGGAEVYLKNILIEIEAQMPGLVGRFEIIHLNRSSKPFNLEFKEIFTGSINRTSSILRSRNYENIIFYNSSSVYRMLENLKSNKMISSKIIEIYHSDLVWSDSMAVIKERSQISSIIRVSDGLLNDRDVGGAELVTVPVGINIDIFKNRDRDKIRNDLNIIGNRPIIGIVARLSPEKNIDYILDIASKMDDFLFLFVGDGKGLADYRKSTLENVRFLGYKNDVHKYHCAFDSLLLASKIEGTPISIIEAMATERVVFTSNVGEISSLISNGDNGVFITGVVDEDVEIIRSNFSKRSIAKNARASILKHDIRIVCKKFISTLFSKSRYELVQGEVSSNLGEFI